MLSRAFLAQHLDESVLIQLFGECHHLFQELKKHAERVYDYKRMSLNTFTYKLTVVNDCVVFDFIFQVGIIL